MLESTDQMHYSTTETPEISIPKNVKPKMNEQSVVSKNTNLTEKPKPTLPIKPTVAKKPVDVSRRKNDEAEKTDAPMLGGKPKLPEKPKLKEKPKPNEKPLVQSKPVIPRKLTNESKPTTEQGNDSDNRLENNREESVGDNGADKHYKNSAGGKDIVDLDTDDILQYIQHADDEYQDVDLFS